MGIAEDMRRLRQEIEYSRGQRQEKTRERKERVQELARESDEIRAEARRDLQTVAAELLAMQRERLLEVCSRVEFLRGEARELIASSRVERMEEGAKAAELRQEAIHARREAMGQLQAEVAEMRALHQQFLEQERVEGSAKRRLAIQGLSHEVSELREGVQILLGEFKQEFEALRHYWNSAGEEFLEEVANSAPPTPVVKAVVPKEPIKEAAKEAKNVRRPEEAPSVVAPVAGKAKIVPQRRKKPGEEPDDLELIVGIGPSTKEVLYGSGLYYFHDLAEISPEGLKQNLGNLARFANVEHWIEQAQELIEG